MKLNWKRLIACCIIDCVYEVLKSTDDAEGHKRSIQARLGDEFDKLWGK